MPRSHWEHSSEGPRTLRGLESFLTPSPDVRRSFHHCRASGHNRFVGPSARSTSPRELCRCSARVLYPGTHPKLGCLMRPLSRQLVRDRALAYFPGENGCREVPTSRSLPKTLWSGKANYARRLFLAHNHDAKQRAKHLAHGPRHTHNQNAAERRYAPCCQNYLGTNQQMGRVTIVTE